MRTNQQFTRIKLRNTGGEEKAFVELGLSLKENKKHQLQILDFSDNSVGTKGMIALQDALQSWDHALKILDLSNCRIGGMHDDGINMYCRERTCCSLLCL